MFSHHLIFNRQYFRQNTYQKYEEASNLIFVMIMQRYESQMHYRNSQQENQTFRFIFYLQVDVSSSSEDENDERIPCKYVLLGCEKIFKNVENLKNHKCPEKPSHVEEEEEQENGNDFTRDYDSNESDYTDYSSDCSELQFKNICNEFILMNHKFIQTY